MFYHNIEEFFILFDARLSKLYAIREIIYIFICLHAIEFE